MNFYIGLFYSLRTANWSFPRCFQLQLCNNFFFPCVYYIYSQSEPLIFHTNNMCKEYQLWSLLVSNVLCAVNCQLMSDCCYRTVLVSNVLCAVNCQLMSDCCYRTVLVSNVLCAVNCQLMSDCCYRTVLVSNVLCAVNCQLMSDCCYRTVLKSLRLAVYHFASQQLWVGVEVGCSGSCASVSITMAAF